MRIMEEAEKEYEEATDLLADIAATVENPDDFVEDLEDLEDTPLEPTLIKAIKFPVMDKICGNQFVDFINKPGMFFRSPKGYSFNVPYNDALDTVKDEIRFKLEEREEDDAA